MNVCTLITSTQPTIGYFPQPEKLPHWASVSIDFPLLEKGLAHYRRSWATFFPGTACVCKTTCPVPRPFMAWRGVPWPVPLRRVGAAPVGCGQDGTRPAAYPCTLYRYLKETGVEVRVLSNVADVSMEVSGSPQAHRPQRLPKTGCTIGRLHLLAVPLRAGAPLQSLRFERPQRR